jgi:16S rRNA (cytosine967-C5)-methyltransferase
LLAQYLLGAMGSVMSIRMQKKPHPPQTVSARAQAIAVLGDVLGARHTLDEAWALHPFAGAEADARFAMLLTLSALQHLGQLDALLAKYLEKPLPGKRRSITNALRIGLVQLLLLDTPAHAAVNETVAAVKRGRDAGLAGLVNAVLQKAARERPPLPAPITNVPPLLRARWEKHYGKPTVAAMAQVAVQRPPLDLNTRTDMAGGVRMDAEIIRLPADHAAVETLPDYTEGAFFVQDLAASYPVRLLGDMQGLHVLDLCAAPGGKAAQLLQRGARVTVLDRSPTRMQVLQENMARLNTTVEVVVADALQWQPAHAYDAILLDAPCSATGTWRRHPEVVHIVTPEDIAELAVLQRAMLARAWGWLKPGGKLVYCVCSLEPEEGEAQAQWFRDAHADARLVAVDAAMGIAPESIRDGMLRTLPSHRVSDGGMDGFFAVCITKQP